MPAVAWIAVAVAVNGVIALLARRKKALSVDGAIAAFVLGTALMAINGGWLYWSAMVVFFLTGTAVSHLGREQKRKYVTMHEHGSERNWVQVVSNGGVGLVAAILCSVTAQGAFAIAAVISFAAANADTWGSEIGVLSRRTPRSILTGREITAGMSGGITVEGTFASLFGSLVIAVWFGLLALVALLVSGSQAGNSSIVRLLGTSSIIVVSGFLGSIIDSILGASIQARYVTAGDGSQQQQGEPTERSGGPNGPNTLVRGVRFVTNDVVNLVSVAAASAAGGLFYAAAY
jgi:uncharacterized protein (TIGR00297 family)